MKVVWILNVTIPDAAEAFGEKTEGKLPWIENILPRIQAKTELTICCPVSGKIRKTGEKGGIIYYGIPRKHLRGDKYEKGMKKHFKEVFLEEVPDVIHIYGTEFPSTLSAVQAAEEAGCLEHVVISIQGLVSIYYMHFMNGIPGGLKYLMVPKNFIRGFNIAGTQHSCKKRGKYECEAIRKVRHIIGRTDWDRACTSQINPRATYYLNNETLRAPFYKDEWHYETCIPHTIFVSQGGSPIKGFHHAVVAVSMLRERYPDICLKVTGRNVLGRLSAKRALSLNPYDWYIRGLITKNHLEDRVVFLGSLNAEQMKEQYLKCNVFILPSSIENSPNSLGEAMLLGVPSVAADVGGVSSMALAEEVYLYPHDEFYMLAYYIGEVFDNTELAQAMAVKAQMHARMTHNAEENGESLLDIYAKINAGG